uniref:RecQ-mediated genome instability protein 1 n=1 Tax=Spongospora subterranea TaxID=70186 RepID=A0A0H5RAE4_9EUKA|eukprot:CRZ11125.1 hypothetical protein [Spongospora subterranea]
MEQIVVPELASAGMPRELFHNEWIASASAACQNNIEKILIQLCASDIVQSCRPSLPATLNQLDLLPGPCILQVIDGGDVGQLHGKPDRNLGQRTLKLALTDGVRTVYALEWRPISGLTGRYGMKLLCRNVPVRLSHLLLCTENTFVLGGSVPCKVEPVVR